MLTFSYACSNDKSSWSGLGAYIHPSNANREQCAFVIIFTIQDFANLLLWNHSFSCYDITVSFLRKSSNITDVQRLHMYTIALEIQFICKVGYAIKVHIKLEIHSRTLTLYSSFVVMKLTKKSSLINFWTDKRLACMHIHGI